MLRQVRGFSQTGIPGLDEMLGGRGFPRGHNIFLLGSPGSGKTTLAMQYLHYGATEANEPGVFLTLDEKPMQLRENMSAFGWDVSKLEAEHLLTIIDASPLRRLRSSVKLGDFSIGRKEFSIVSLTEVIRRSANDLGAKRIIIDPIASFMLQYRDEFDRRDALLTLMDSVSELECTTIFISEMTHTSLERAHQFEEYLAEGVMIMMKRLAPEGKERFFQVEKMRGVLHDTKARPYNITTDGIKIFPTEQFV